MAKRQSRGRAGAAAGVKAGKRGVKKEGLKLKDLDAKNASKVRGGRKAGKDQQEYFKVTMSDLLISS